MQFNKIRHLIIFLFISLALLTFLAPILGNGESVSAEPGEINRFHPYEMWSDEYSDADGWKFDRSYWGTIQYPDLNGDGNHDICGRASDGIYCALSEGISYIAYSLWGPTYGDGQVWNIHESHWGTIRFADINGDGMDDVCGRGTDGVYCGISTGLGFTMPMNWNDSFGDNYGWKDEPSFWGTIRFPDLNGDGMADICGRHNSGISCSLSDGQSFVSVSTWGNIFSNTNGWHADESNWGTIQYADLNGDGRDDVCGRGTSGIVCGVSTGTTFANQSFWSFHYNNSGDWEEDEAYWGTIRFPDVTGDGMADVCGRYIGGVFCNESDGSKFGAPFYWDNNFSDANGWKDADSHWGTIEFPELNGDGMADICGRDSDGMYCAISNGFNGFEGFSNWQEDFGDTQGWHTSESYWQTIQFIDLNADNNTDVCGRAATGIFCAPAAEGGQPPPPPPPPNLNFKSFVPVVLN